MKAPTFEFSLMDFLAYLIPGTIMLLALAGLLLMTPLAGQVESIQLNWVTSLVGIALSYFLGVVVSSFSFGWEDKIYKHKKLKDPRDGISLPAVEKHIREAFEHLCFKVDSWDSSCFYVARSVVRELSPESAAAADRQNSLRQLRRNSFIPVAFSGVVGFLWGVRCVILFKVPGHVYWGAALLIISLVAPYILIRYHIPLGMHRNRNREAREICSGLIAAYKHRRHGTLSDRE